ncbi:hypothetical protein D3C73_1057660 [compost metagenome]
MLNGLIRSFRTIACEGVAVQYGALEVLELEVETADACRFAVIVAFTVHHYFNYGIRLNHSGSRFVIYIASIGRVRKNVNSIYPYPDMGYPSPAKPAMVSQDIESSEHLSMAAFCHLTQDRVISYIDLETNGRLVIIYTGKNITFGPVITCVLVCFGLRKPLNLVIVKVNECILRRVGQISNVCPAFKHHFDILTRSSRLAAPGTGYQRQQHTEDQT